MFCEKVLCDPGTILPSGLDEENEQGVGTSKRGYKHFTVTLYDQHIYIVEREQKSM